jgi:hypothetical protein
MWLRAPGARCLSSSRKPRTSVPSGGFFFALVYAVRGRGASHNQPQPSSLSHVQHESEPAQPSKLP